MRKDHDWIRLELPDPFSRSIVVNYAQLSTDYVVILTGERKNILQICPFVKVHGKWFRASPMELHSAINCLKERYSADHVDRYFKDSDSAAYIISPFSGTVSLVEPVRKAYDSISTNYLEGIMSDRLQREFRRKTSEFLSQFLWPGISVLEIGCSDAGEVALAGGAEIQLEYHCVDVSPMALAKAASKVRMPGASFDLWDYGTYGTKGSYDLIFSTFGALDTMNVQEIREIISKNLKPGGVIVGTVLNRMSFMDILLSGMTGNLDHLRGRIHGIMTPETSRYPLQVFSRYAGKFLRELGLEILDFRGISMIHAPYNYRRFNSVLFRIPHLNEIDEKLSLNSFFSQFCDYTCFAARYNVA